MQTSLTFLQCWHSAVEIRRSGYAVSIVELTCMIYLIYWLCKQVLRRYWALLMRVVAVYNQTWPSAVRTEETTSMDWFSFITVMTEDWWTRPLRLSLANGLPALFQTVLALLCEATKIWIRTATQVLQEKVHPRVSVNTLSSSLISSFNSLSLVSDLIVGAFGADKAVVYRYVIAHRSALEKYRQFFVF